MPIAGVIASSISGHLSTNNYFLISQSLPSAVSTVTFSGIPATYKSLQVRFNLVTSLNTQNFTLQYNSDTSTANYANHYLLGTGTAASASGQASGTFGKTVLNQQGSVSTYPNVGIVDIIDYANTNKNKTIKSLLGSNQNTSAGVVEIDSGVWLSTAAITSIAFGISGGTFTGTISLYGVS